MSYKNTEKLSRTFGLSSSAHRKRYREVVKVLAKYGLEEFLLSEKGKHIPYFYKSVTKKADVSGLTRARRLKLAIEDLDGGFVKLAQILSNRPDIIPQEYIDEFESLQDHIPAFSTEEVIRIIESELNDKLHRLFLMFDDEPLASGSIAQIHRAILFDGTPVVIKVQRPGIENKFKIDFDVLRYIARYASRIKYLKSQFNNSNPINELTSEIFKELDFNNELYNIKTFEQNFEGNPDIKIPKAYTSYSSGKVLTMEYVIGMKVTSVKEYAKFGITPEYVADKLIDLGLIQLFDHRFFHGDPHPGNILVLEDGRICFLDFGLVGRITTRQRQNIVDLLIAFARNDASKIASIVLKYSADRTKLNEKVVEERITELLDNYYDKNLNEIHVGDALKEIFAVILDYEIKLNFNVYLLLKALSSYEGIGNRIFPEFELAPYAQKVTQKLIREQLSPQRIIKEAYFSITDSVELLTSLPGDVKELLGMLQSGRLKANISISDLNETIDYAFHRVDKVANRLVIAIILASVILGSSIILHIAPDLDSGMIFIFAGIGFVLSLIIAFALLISIIRNKGI